MLRVAGRFILDWNPTRQDVSQSQHDGLSEFIVPYVYQAPSTYAAAAKVAATASAPVHHADLAAPVTHTSVAGVVNHYAPVTHADLSALDRLVFAAAPMAQHTTIASDAPPETPLPHSHEVLMTHNAALSYGPTMISSMVPHPEFSPVALTAPPRLMDDFQ